MGTRDGNKLQQKNDSGGCNECGEKVKEIKRTRKM